MVAVLLAASLLTPHPALADDLGSARLLIAGTRLTVSPESQTVPFNTPTIVETALAGYDPAQGVLPEQLRVVADFTGPEIDGILTLQTRPGQPLRIPRLSLKGEYLLDNIRLVQGEEILAYAQPRSTVVLVTQVLVTRVTSRALTLDEIRSYGIVVDDDNFTAFNFTFGFAVDGEVYDYNLPVLYTAGTSNPYEILVDGAPELAGAGFGTASPRFKPPQMAPFTLTLKGADGGTAQRATGGCDSAFGCVEDPEVRLPGVILFPTDVSLLHQYFSVVLMAKNDAPAGDPLVIRDLTARVTLPPGLRMAETEPPTPLGVPVPVRVPGPDGEVGTGDDLTFLVAQAGGRAEVLVEGREQGTHVVEFGLEGVLEGLPGGALRRVTGQARGAVVVRDPTLGVTISHPATVRADEEYDLRLTVANTSNAPVNLVTLSLPAAGLSGAQVVGDSQVTVPTLLPGESEVVEFRLRSLRTGKVVASSSRSPHFVDPTFELTVGVGDNGIPLSPDAIVLPRAADALPAPLVREALGLTGLAFSLATAPAASLNPELPRMDLNRVDGKVYHLGQAGRHLELGEETFDAVATLAAAWTGARDEDWEWDRLRRTTDRGGRLGDAVAAVLATEAAATSPRTTLDRFAATTAFQGSLQAALAVGVGARLEVSSRTTGQELSGGGLDPARRRELPFADLYDLAGTAEMALLARPEEGGHQARLTVDGGGSADLHLLVPGSGGGLRRVSWSAVSLGAAGLAVADFTAGDDVLTLFVDGDGDGVVDQQLAGTATALAPRPFTAVAAVQKETEVSGHVVEVLFSADLDLASLVPLDPQRFRLPGNLSNGGMVPAEADLAAFNWTQAESKFAGLRNTRVVQVVFSNPVSPYATHTLTVEDVAATTGEAIAAATLPVTTTVTDPGGIVEGTVVGPDGEPVPFARVELYESDARWVDGACIRHRTAAVESDAAGAFRFGYVRNGSCSDVFLLRGTDPRTGHSGEAMGRVRFAGQVHALDVVMLGRGTVRGRVSYDDGTVPAELEVIAYSPVFAQGVDARVFPDGSYEAKEVPVGTVSLAASDRQGSFVFQTIEIATAGAVVDRDLVILRRAPEEATGDVAGTVWEVDGTTPVYNAYLALYVDGELVGMERSAYDGTFDFGTVPAGQAEIEAFDGETGLAGAQLHFEVLADRVNAVDVLLRDERGAVEGHVYRQTAQGQVAVAGAVVWVGGTPFNTVTDDQGFYRLDGIFAGDRQVYAADLERQEQTAERVTVSDGVTATRDLRFVEDFGAGGIVGEVLGFTGNPVPGAKVHIAGGDQSWWHESVTDTLGRFSIPDLKPGTYELHAVSGDGPGAAGGTATVRIRYEGETPFASIRYKRGTIRGRTVALDELGQRVGVQSLVTYRTTTVQSGLVTLSWTPTVIETGADGRFEIPGALAGRYSLAVSNPFHGDQTVSGELVFHGDVVEHEIVFQRNGSISGVILDVDGETPVEGAVVHLRHPSFADYDLTTDAEGRFSFDLVPPGGRFPIDVEVSRGALFRRGRVWVGYNRHGLDMEVVIVLPKQGTVSGWVEESSGQRVPGAAVTLIEHAYPHRRLVQTADGEGYYSFTNVFAGRVTVEAQAPSLGGLGGKTVAAVTTESEEVWTLIALEGNGEIAGTVVSPLDGEPVASAQVTLYRWTGGVLDAATADAAGGFRFRQLPIGLYRVWVFDPTTGRHGATDAVPVDFDGQLTEIEVELEVRGEVEGHLYDPDTAATVPGATVELVTDSLVHFKTYSSADADGYYEFLGVPEGDFTLRTGEPEGRRRARGGGAISEEGERVTVDLYLEATGSVTGTVWNPPGAPAGAFGGVNTVVREGGRVVGASLENPFTFDGLIVGRGLKLEAYEVGGEHRAVGEAVVSEQGQVVSVELTMEPIGAAAVTVTDSFGSPVAGADLRLTSSGFYGRRVLDASTGADGRALFAGVGEGSLGAFVVNPVNSLKGSATGRLTLDGEQVEIAVQLEDSATLRGRLLLADGATPAADALVAVTVSGRQYQLRAGSGGAFEFPSLPLGGYTLIADEYFGAGASIERSGTLVSNGEVVDLGALVLDDEPPELVAHTPPSGAGDLPLATVVTLSFNEPLDRDRFTAGWFRFRKLSGASVAYTAAWSDGDATVTLTPTSPLASHTAYEVIVDAAYDLAGRGLKERVKTVFSTVDQQPPGVVDVLPRDGRVQVPVDTDLRITFSEPVEPASLSGNSLALVDTSTGQQVTTTWQLAAEERLAIVTPQSALLTDRTYRLTVQGVRDRSGNTMTVPVVTTFDTPDTIAPTIGAVDFPAGTVFTAGDDVPLTVSASDASGVARATVRVVSEGWEFAATAAPWQVTALAPVVAAAGTAVELEIEVADLYGNAGSVERTVEVSPLANAAAPQLTVSCARDGDRVVPGFPVEIRLAGADDQRLESFRLLVDGTSVEKVAPVNAAEASHVFTWTPPAAAAGTVFAARLEGRDFAGNVAAADLAFTVPGGVVLTASQSVFASTAGSGELTLAGGTYTLREPLDLAALTVLRGATLTAAAAGEPVDLTVSGEAQVQCGARVELAVVGFAGGSLGHPDGYGPAGVAPSTPDAGGSHGGAGIAGNDGTAAAGAVYDSVYTPRLPGAGGAYDGFLGGPGGGALRLRADHLKLEGTIRAQGGYGCDGGAGAGGSIDLDVATLSGSGTVTAHGGSTCAASGAGGGGRIGVRAGAVDGFDPAVQVRAEGGRRGDTADGPYAAPGTVYLHLPGDTRGSLRIDNGIDGPSGKHRFAAPVTLPLLGGGDVASFQAAAADAWVGASTPLPVRWRGAWMVLLDAGGGEIGAYRVLDLDTDGRALLAGAATATGVAAYRGEYRFDRVELGPGVTLAVADPVVTGELVLDGGRGFSGDLRAETVVVASSTTVEGSVTAQAMVVRSGAWLEGSGGRLDLTVAGTLTVESGGYVGLTGGGFGASQAPAGLTVSTGSGTGGSHGGRGAGASGEVFGSVYVPHLGGGGGADAHHAGSPGGGVVTVSAGELVLDGVLQARGASWCGGGGGGGGAVRLDVGTLRGTGRVDAGGGDENTGNCIFNSSGGGGGRIALRADTLVGFDPATQLRARGGENRPRSVFGGPGTVFYRLPEHTGGVLVVDNGTLADGTLRSSDTVTALPALGTGPVAALDSAGADGWLTAAAAFRGRWLGARVVLTDGAGGELGTYEVVEIDAAGRLRLAGAGGVVGAAGYRGEYRFDRVELRSGSRLQSLSPLEVGELQVDGGGRLGGEDVEVTTVTLEAGTTTLAAPLSAQTLTLRSGAVLVPEGSEPLVLDVAGTLTVESGATIAAVGRGYVSARAPAGLTVSTGSGTGGSHGGRGEGTSGETYDSVYRPRLGGGGGAPGHLTGAPGGGVLRITAGELVLDGLIRATGDSYCGGGGGAGGSILLDVGTVRGGGLAEADGGDEYIGDCIYLGSGGGGGRVVLDAAALDGFDPEVQLRAWGGRDRPQSYGGPGTVYYRTAEHTYGALVVDNGEEADGTDRLSSAVTRLPELGEGAVAGLEASGSDAWLTGPAPLRDRWLGAWVALADGTGGDLGTYEAVEIDAAGRLRLAGAAAVSGAADYRGEYRFDRVVLRGGSSLESPSPLVSGELSVEGGGKLLGDVAVSTLVFEAGTTLVSEALAADNLTLESGAVLALTGAESLAIDVAGVMTVESGATVTVSDRGYPSATAPDGVAVSTGYGIGGSHGGRGEETAGATFGSVYRPTLPGGGGAPGRYTGSPGGGVLRVSAGELVLDGTLRAKGGSWCGGGGGGGGSILLDVGTLRGTGAAEAGGGDRNKGNCIYDSRGGGGGRVALRATNLVGFDPQTQLRAWGGEHHSLTRFGGPGTVYYRLPEHTWGVLVIDNGTLDDGTYRGSDGVTDLPPIRRGTVGAVTPQEADAWIEPQDPAVEFGVGVVGAWVRIAAVDYPVLDQGADRRRLLLEGAAGAVTVGQEYVGVYKFDAVHVRGPQQLVFGDALEAATVDLDPGASVEFRELDPPAVTLSTGTSFFSGDAVEASAAVSDASAITRVVFTFAGETVTDTAAPWEASFVAPVVEVAEGFEVRAEATDADGNVGADTRSVQVQPLAAGDPPAVAVTCPTAGALVAPGTGLDVTVAASHDDGIEKVDFLLGDDPTVLATDTAAPYTHHLAAPAGAADGDVLTLRARARSFSGTTAEATVQATVVAASVVLGDTVLAAGDLSLEDTSVVVAAGTLTVEGPHSFRDLVVLDGAAVTHPAVSGGAEDGLDLSVTGDVYVACGGVVDAAGRGWPAALARLPAGGWGVLSSEDFSTDLAAWQPVDDTTYSGPSNWHLYADFLRMTSNIHEPGGAVGTHIYRTDAFGLEDYRFAFRLNSGDDDGIGAVFRYQDADNYYRLLMHRSAGYRRLEKRVDGLFTTLAEDGVAYSRNRWYEMELVADGAHLEVWVDGERIFTAEDDTFSGGSYGFAAVGNASTHFDEVRVVALGGAAPSAGGSHGGRGAGFTGAGRIVGSPYDPNDPGAGGGGRLGTAGGGVVRIAAGGDLVIDGAVSAAGATAGGSGSLGAGGAVRLDAAEIRGAGTIDASGGGDGTARAAGGGGRVALYAAAVEPGILSRTTAAGGAASTAALTGGAGTLFVQRDAQPLGDLILDNAGRATEAWTELLSVPPGTVGVVGTDTLTDSAASFPHSLYGTEVALNGDTATLWTVLGHGDGGDTLTLDVSATPLAALPGDAYELLYRFDAVTVRGGARGVSLAPVLSASAADVEAGSLWSPAYVPSLGFSAPADGAGFVSGDPVTFSVTVDDPLGVGAVTLEIGGVEHVDTAAPYSWTWTAPLVAGTTPYTATVSTVDRSGHPLTDTLTVDVSPNPDATPPQVLLGTCPADGDLVGAGAPLGLAFTVSDGEKLAAWRVKVNGVVVDEATGVDIALHDGTVTWAPPAGDAPGTVYAVTVEAEDYGGNLTSAQRSLRLPAGTVLSGDQSLDSSLDGADLVLTAGSFVAQEPLQLNSLVLVGGAVLTSPAGGAVAVAVSNEMKVQCGAALDVSHLGYAGATHYGSPGGAPAGVAGARRDYGGSHGGVGVPWDYDGPAGEVYGSVYRPSLGGGGGAVRHTNSSYYRGGAGGGVVDLEAGTLVLDGEIRARGEKRRESGYNEASGAGGSVLITAGTVGGAGMIDASGGDFRYDHYRAGAGGGGRVALYVDGFAGFDPATQVSARGGARMDRNYVSSNHGAPGTVYLLQPGMTYGELRIDAGEEGGVDRVGPKTELPALGSGTVSAFEAVDGDARLTGDAAFASRWEGAWMVLLDAAGGELGAFRVSVVDGSGRALLTAAAAVSGAVSYRGEYRFDRVEVTNGAGLVVHDPLHAPELVSDGSGVEGPVVTTTLEIAAATVDTTLSEEVTADSVVVRSGARVVPPADQDGVLRLSVPGTLTVESGAALDVSHLGYAGATHYGSPGGAPAGMAGAQRDCGGSHGGVGVPWDYPGPAGEVYGSVYRPSLGGGGGAVRHTTGGSYRGGAGGGVVNLEVGTLVVDGEIRARGEKRRESGYNEASGAGGSVLITAGTVGGAGMIDASGGDFRYDHYRAGAGGGGRVALYVDGFAGFDPATQVTARGGARMDRNYVASTYGGAGTVFVRSATSVYGDLTVDQGGTGGLVPGGTPVPAIGAGTVGTTEVDADDPTDLWIEPQDAGQTFALGVTGAWVRVDGADYRILGQTADRRRVRLEGAAGLVSTGDAFAGVYKFDAVTVHGGAVLEFLDVTEPGTTDVDADSQLITP